LPVRFRLPVVPGLTDDDENLRAVAAFLDGLGVRELTLLRYHAMGEAKIARVAAPITPLGRDASRCARHALERASAELRRHGVEVTK
jgi:pyruvate-formate lyase-activating enzyme